MTTDNLYKIFLDSNGVSTDSRAIKSGSIFFALKGDNFDGNTFALNALEAGAKFAVVDDKSFFSNDKSLSANDNLIVVDNVLLALQDLARYHRTQLAIPIVGLTGTNGKTTTKELITTVLSVKYKVVSTQGNLNNHIGVPLTILKMDATTQIGVVEMGASAPGEIATLVSISQPNYGLITNVGRAHLLGFGSFEGVKSTKGELYDFLVKIGGTALYNIDNSHLCEMIQSRPGLKTIPYGLKFEGSDILPTTSAEPFLRMKLHSGSKCHPESILHSESKLHSDIQINTNLIGAYNADNIMAALAVGTLFEVDTADAIEAISKYIPSNNRSQLVNGKNNILIVDAYNANPTSMRAALENFAKMERGETTLVIGDMLELGTESQNEHKAILELIKDIDPDHLMFVGEEFAKAAAEFGSASAADIVSASGVSIKSPTLMFTVNGSFPMVKASFFKTSLELRDYLITNPITGNTFLIKGSRGTRLERILDIL